MPDEVHGAVEEEVLGDILRDEAETRVTGEVREVVGGAGDQVVEDRHAVSAREQQIGEMGTEKAGAAGDHGVGPTSWSRIAFARGHASVVSGRGACRRPPRFGKPGR